MMDIDGSETTCMSSKPGRTMRVKTISSACIASVQTTARNPPANEYSTMRTATTTSPTVALTPKTSWNIVPPARNCEPTYPMKKTNVTSAGSTRSIGESPGSFSASSPTGVTAPVSFRPSMNGRE
jgi:hypothetical protein